MVVAIILWRACYGGLERGLFAEVLLLAGVVAASAFTLNFAGPVAEWARPWLFNDPRADAIVYALVFLNLLLFVRLLVHRITKLVPVESSSWIMHGGGFIAGLAHGIWWAAMVLVVLVGLSVPYLKGSVVERSVVGSRLLEQSRHLVREVTGRFPGAERRRENLVPPLMSKQIGSARQ